MKFLNFELISTFKSKNRDEPVQKLGCPSLEGLSLRLNDMTSETETHMKKFHEETKGSYECICGDIFSPIESLAVHIENIHRCFLCDSMFKTAIFLYSHIESDCFSIVGLIEGNFYKKEVTITPEISNQLEDGFKCHSHSSPQFGVGLKNVQELIVKSAKIMFHLQIFPIDCCEGIFPKDFISKF